MADTVSSPGLAVNSPTFMPPDATRPIIGLIPMRTGTQIKAALAPLGMLVATGRMDFSAAHDLLCVSFIQHVWSGKDARTVTRFADRAVTELDRASLRAERVGEDIERHERIALGVAMWRGYQVL